MRLVTVFELKEGDSLAQSLCDRDGRLMLQQGVKLTDRLIEGIKKRGISQLYVQGSPESEPKEPKEPKVPPKPAASKRQLRIATEELLGSIFQAVQNDKPIPVASLMAWAKHATVSVMSDGEMAMHYGDFHAEPSCLSRHSVNVCFLAMLTAKALGYKELQLRDVAIGSLLHDIGLVRPNGQGDLYIKHPVLGHERLRKIPEIPSASLKMVLQHHEQIDGRGFPYGIGGEEFEEAAQIVGICSEFDYFVHDRLVHRQPGEEIEYVMAKVDSAFDHRIVRAFLKAYQPYPVGTAVRLTGGLKGTVCEQNRGHSYRPVVKLQQFGTRLNLMEYTTFMIEEVLDVQSEVV